MNTYLTKAQRLKAYRDVLTRFRQVPHEKDSICDYLPESIEHYPELMESKPTWRGLWQGWFDWDEEGYMMRVMLLDYCIKQLS